MWRDKHHKRYIEPDYLIWLGYTFYAIDNNCSQMSETLVFLVCVETRNVMRSHIIRIKASSTSSLLSLLASSEVSVDSFTWTTSWPRNLDEIFRRVWCSIKSSGSCLMLGDSRWCEKGNRFDRMAKFSPIKDSIHDIIRLFASANLEVSEVSEVIDSFSSRTRVSLRLRNVFWLEARALLGGLA